MRAYELSASWAVWPHADTYDRLSDISFPTIELGGVLHARTIILGLNRGGAGHNLKAWQNFHTGSKHNDHFLAEAFRDTPHWGGYMTDLLSEFNSDSTSVDVSPVAVRSDVAELIDELLTLGVSDPLFILLGQKTARAFRDHEGVLAPALGLARLRSVEVPHYSAANGAKHRNQPRVYRAIVHAALGASEPR
jgi:hypothetical protein